MISPRAFWHWIAPGALLAALLTSCDKPSSAASPADSHPAFRARVLCVGKSMLPTYGESEWVEVEFCRYEDLRGGDTVIRWDSVMRIFVHHRLEFRNETGKWQTRGDNNGGSDRGVMTPDEFVGRTHKLSTLNSQP